MRRKRWRASRPLALSRSTLPHPTVGLARPTSAPAREGWAPPNLSLACPRFRAQRRCLARGEGHGERLDTVTGRPWRWRLNLGARGRRAGRSPSQAWLRRAAAVRRRRCPEVSSAARCCLAASREGEQRDAGPRGDGAEEETGGRGETSQRWWVRSVERVSPRGGRALMNQDSSHLAKNIRQLTRRPPRW